MCVCSLLEETVDFEPMTAPAPVVSEETTHSLEDIIRQRILDQVNLQRGWGQSSQTLTYTGMG